MHPLFYLTEVSDAPYKAFPSIALLRISEVFVQLKIPKESMHIKVTHEEYCLLANADLKYATPVTFEGGDMYFLGFPVVVD